MSRRVVAFLVVACAASPLAATQATAFGWYGAHRYHTPASGFYCFRGPRWDYAAAYYQSYRHHRKARRWCGCRKG